VHALSVWLLWQPVDSAELRQARSRMTQWLIPAGISIVPSYISDFRIKCDRCIKNYEIIRRNII
jgi:hypothetical protein